jgi:hypothetical protein
MKLNESMTMAGNLNGMARMKGIQTNPYEWRIIK